MSSANDPFLQQRKWNTNPIVAEDGVLVASDISHEWLLPWWWDHYKKTNVHPVCFVDLGMSSKMRLWCQERGIYRILPTPDIFVAEKNQIDADQRRSWESQYGTGFWTNRHAWFKKPLACLLTPYQRSIWIDLDCEVRGSLQDLFPMCDGIGGLAIARENTIYSKDTLFNSGVLVFKRDNPLIERWAHLAFFENHIYPGDQDIFAVILEEEKKPYHELPAVYNWSRWDADNPHAVIMHWHGPHGKRIIAHKIMKSNLATLHVTF